MATSLAQQLQRLAVPQTSVLKQDKKRPSLLFDLKEAATLSRETIYQIGLEGLEELIQKNETFAQFEDTLFHITSKQFERSVQNTEANEKLDKSLKKFLLLLAPYFLLNCCHKALEWLINRFSIHEYNREDLLLLSLPYHESNIFVRVIQLLKFKDTRDSFYFLKQLQKPGAHLPKQSLLNHAASNSGFLKLVSKYIKDLLKHHEKPEALTVAFNFYCTLFTGTIEFSDNITEDQVSQMLPMLLKGLNSSIADFCAGSYVITARLASKTSFSDALLDKFVEKISEVPVSTLKTEAILVLLVIYQSQKQYKCIPPSAIGNLSEKLWLPKTLHSLQMSGSFIYPFLEILLKSFAYEGINNDLMLARDMIKSCLDYVKVKDEFVTTILSCILDAVPPKMDITTEAKEWLTEIIQLVENQYPSPFDKEVYKILSLSSDKTSIRRRKCLSKILKNTVTYEGKFDIFNKLYHPNASIRTEALNFLLENFDSLKDNDKEIINNSFMDRLRDDDATVVNNTLQVIKKTGKMDRDDLKSSLIILATKYQKDKTNWNVISNNVLGMLTSFYPPNDWEVFLAIFPFLLPSNSRDLDSAKKILKSPFFANHDLFKQHIHELKRISDKKVFIKRVLKILTGNTVLENVKSFVEIIQRIPDESWDTFKKYMSSLILTSLLPKNSSLETGSTILDLLLAFYNSSEVKYKDSNTLDNYVKFSLLGKFPVQGFLKCLRNVTRKVNKPEQKLRDFSLNNPDNKFLVTITLMLMENKSFLQEFLGTYCQNFEEEIEFLLNLCISKNSILTDDFKKNVLDHIKTKLKDNEEVPTFVFIEKRVVAFLIVILSDNDAEIRKAVIDIMNTIVDASTRKTNSYYHLLNFIVKSKEEIIMDNDQVPLIMFNCLHPTNAKKKSCAVHLNIARNSLLKLSYHNDSPCYIKAGILKALSLINSYEMLDELANTALDILENESNNGIKSFNAKIIGFIVSRVDSTIIRKLKLNTNTWKLIETFIRDDKTVLYNDDEARISPSPLMLNQMDSDLFSNLQDEVVIKKLLDLIIEVGTIAHDPEVLPTASKIFKHIDLNAEWIKESLIEMRDVQSPKIDESKRKRRIGVIPTVDILDTLEWKKGVTVLELIQDKKKIRNSETILPLLFDLLKRCLDFDEQTAVEYPKQLLLSLILHCCTKIEEKIPENVFNVELIVQCIRASQNPQTHHHALLALAHTAHMIPNQVLHNMMAIFTFMGSSVLRHDDAYSFQIISKIVDTIIPIIVASNEQESKIHNITKVLRVFVDVILDVPEHRRMPLYKQLLEKIDVKEHLYIFLLLIFEAQIVHSAHEKQRKENTQKRLEIAADLCREFSPEIVILNCISLLKYLNQLPDEKEEGMEVDDIDATATFSVSSHTPKDFRHYKYVLVKYTTNLLGSPEFVNQVAALSEEDELKLEPLFKEMIVNTLKYIQRISKVSENASNTPQSQYWKVLLHLSYDILDSVNALLTPQMFLLVTNGLMIHSLFTVRRRVLELLNNKLQHNSQFFEDCKKNELYSLIRPIVTIIQGIDDEDVDTEQETIIQTALLSLKLLVKLLAWKEPEKFVQILDFITGILKSGKAQNNVLASVVLCLAELCVHLKGHAIASLPDFMPVVIKILKRQKHEEVSSVLLRSLVTTIEKILNSMPLFLSPYLEKLLIEISLLMARWNINEEEQKGQQFSMKLNAIKQKIGSAIPLRVLLLPIESCYDTLVNKKCFQATSSLLDILAESISDTTGPDINNNLNELTNFFLNTLKFRTDHECTLEDANLVESHIVKALTVLILKLSENTFRPLYYKLYDWAVRSEVKSERLITFYNLSSKIAQSLKGLFVLFAGHFINNAAEVLDACNTVKSEELYFVDQQKNVILLENILSTLNAVFLYDNQKFVNRDRFDILMQPLVDQLENQLDDIDQLIIRNKELISPCLVNFAVAVADDALWKQMNYQILLKMRHNSPKIRLVTLHCITEIVKKLGEDFLPLLPETIPFLAELLEDEEENVEKACQKAIQEMEKVLGEPLQKYF